MDGFSPTKKNEQWEIRQLSKAVFYGGNIDDVLLPLYKNWQFFFTLFNHIISHKNGDYTSPPFQTLDWVHQPYKTMLVLDYMKNLWIDKLIEEQKK